MHLDIVSAEEEIFSGEVKNIIAAATMGEVGIYPNHAPMITTLKPGSVRIKLSGKNDEELVYVSGGILEVQPGSVTVLSDTAVRGSDLDEAKANQAKKQAEDALTKLVSEDESRDYRQAAMLDINGSVNAFTGEKCIVDAGQYIGKNFYKIN